MRQGRERRASHDLKGALESFQAADALMHVPTTGYEVARAQADLALLVEAEDTLLHVLRIPEQAGDPEPFRQARTNARELSESLEARIPSVLVKVEGAPEGAPVDVRVDGVHVPAAALAVPRKLDPGHHVIEAAVGAVTAKKELDLQEKEAQDVTVTLTGVVWPPEQAPAATAPPPVAEPAAAPSSTAAAAPASRGAEAPAGDETPKGRGIGAVTWIAFGVAGAGLVAGSVTGLVSMGDKSSAQSGCTNNLCPPPTWSDIDSARTMATISTVSFVVAGVGAAVGVATLLFRPSAAPAPATQSARIVPWVGAGSAGVVGVF
jgi:hypothetical protein